MHTGEWFAIVFSGFGFLFGGAGLCGVFVLIFRSGRGIQAILGKTDVLDVKLESVVKSINGPLYKKIDSVVKANEDTRKRGEQIQTEMRKRSDLHEREFAKRSGQCASHAEQLKFIKEILAELKQYHTQNTGE